MKTHISHYQLLEVIGSGATSTVYCAQDQKLQRLVALKVLDAGLLEDRVARRRFQNEARALASFQHPAITPIYELDEGDGSFFLAMPLLEGDSLAVRLARSRPSFEETLRIMMEVASGLAYAHRRGVLHRDIKPANIFLCDDGQAKILDFGLALLQNATRYTRPGSLLGTPAYMAPESLLSGQHDQRSDIFSFGAILHEMLTGRRPFVADTLNALFVQILQADPFRPGADVEPVPSHCLPLLQRALHKSPEQRPQNMDEVLEALVEIRSQSSDPAFDRGNTGAHDGKSARESTN